MTSERSTPPNTASTKLRASQGSTGPREHVSPLSSVLAWLAAWRAAGAAAAAAGASTVGVVALGRGLRGVSHSSFFMDCAYVHVHDCMCMPACV